MSLTERKKFCDPSRWSNPPWNLFGDTYLLASGSLHGTLPARLRSLPRPVLKISLLSQGTAVLLLICVAAASFAQKITVEFDQAADFSKYRTFAIRDGQLNSNNPALNNELIKKRIDADIEKALTGKGLKLVSGPSDLNVRYRLGSARRTEVERYPAGWRGLGTRIVRVPHAEGTLVIDLRDPSTRSLVWRGIAREEKSDATQIEGKLDDMVKKSLEKYPPKPK